MSRTFDGVKPKRLFGLGDRLSLDRPVPAAPSVCIGRVNEISDASWTGRHRRVWKGWHAAPNPDFAFPLWWCRDCGYWDMGQSERVR